MFSLNIALTFFAERPTKYFVDEDRQVLSRFGGKSKMHPLVFLCLLSNLLNYLCFKDR